MTTPALPDVAKVEITIVEMTNDFRARNKLEPVKPEDKLVNAARAYAQYLARTGKFAHDADGRQPGDRVATAGYKFCYVAENLALQMSSEGFETRALAKEMVEGWINSEGHRKAMLSAGATETAVALARVPDQNPKFVAVQLFGRPKSLSYSFQISNSSGVPVSYTFNGKKQDVKPGQGVGHTSCTPGQIAFEGAVAEKKGAAATYEARDGALFVLEKAPGGYRVQVRAQERIR